MKAERKILPIPTMKFNEILQHDAFCLEYDSERVKVDMKTFDTAKNVVVVTLEIQDHQT